MKCATLLSIGTITAGIALLTGCGSIPQHAATMTREEVLQQPDVKGKPPVVFQKNLAEVRQAGLRALTFVGCEIKEQAPLFLAGRRPNKFGLFVGSGGETVKIFLFPESETETHVWVDTDLSFVGMAGQQGWNDQVIAEMKRILNKPPGA